MTKQNEYEPDYLVSPGEVLQEYLALYIVEQTGLDEDMVDLLLENMMPITPAIAAKLEKLGRPAHFWLNLERDYQADRARLSGISPWRKVEDEEPPKDGRVVLCCGSDEQYFLAWWIEEFGGNWYDEGNDEYFDEFSEGIKWMPIPKARNNG